MTSQTDHGILRADTFPCPLVRTAILPLLIVSGLFGQSPQPQSEEDRVETFSLAAPGKDFEVYSQTHLRRMKMMVCFRWHVMESPDGPHVLAADVCARKAGPRLWEV
jgi:hypothetical protein